MLAVLAVEDRDVMDDVVAADGVVSPITDVVGRPVVVVPGVWVLESGSDVDEDDTRV